MWTSRLRWTVVVQGGTALHAPTYHLLPADLRLSPSVTLDKLLASPTSKPILSPFLPTLVLFECVLVYMSPAHSSALLRWFSRYFSNGAILGSVVYEMFGLDDAFGRVMVNNLKVHCLSGIHQNRCLRHYRHEMSLYQEQNPILQWSRFRVGFWKRASRLPKRLHCETFDKDILLDQNLTGEYTNFVVHGYRMIIVSRVSRLEMLDEVEELDLVLGHYAISWGTAQPKNEWLNWGINTADCRQDDEY